MLHHIYMNQSVAEEHLVAMGLTMSSNVMSLSSTIKYILQWTVLQRFVENTGYFSVHSMFAFFQDFIWFCYILVGPTYWWKFFSVR